jgi:DNA-binding beta-propeller fold protein YncE
MKKKPEYIPLVIIFLLSIILHSIPVKGTSTTPLFVFGGSNGSDPGTQFTEPDGIAISSNGSFFCSDTYNYRIQVYLADGTYSHNITGFQHVQGIAIGPDGYVYAVDLLNHSVKKFTQSGDFITKFGSVGTGDGQFQEAQGIGIDANTGEIYVSDSVENRVQKFSSGGEFLLKFGSGYLDGPECILIHNELVYVCSESTGTIEVFDTNGDHEFSFGSGMFPDDPEGIIVDPLGNILVNNEGKGKISIFHPNGTHISDWGAGSGSGVGQMNSADGLAYDYSRHRLAVADQENFRILVFDWYEALVEVGLLVDDTPPSIDITGNITIIIDDASGRVLSWIISDMGLSGNYSLKINETWFIEKGFWQPDVPIQYQLGTFTEETTLFYELTVFDKAGNSAVGTGYILIRENPTFWISSSSTTTSKATNFTSGLLILSCFLFLILIRRKRKK